MYHQHLSALSVGSTLFFFPLRRGGATGGQFQRPDEAWYFRRGTDLTRGARLETNIAKLEC